MNCSIQSYYGNEYSYCFGCGKNHASGLHLESFLQNDGSTIMQTTPPEEYTGGVPHNLYGGYMAMLFDCHGTASAAAFYLENCGKELSAENMERFVTAHLDIDFLAPTPMHLPITVTAQPIEVTERKVILTLSLEVDGKITAKAKMVAVRFRKA